MSRTSSLPAIRGSPCGHSVTAETMTVRHGDAIHELHGMPLTRLSHSLFKATSAGAVKRGQSTQGDAVHAEEFFPRRRPPFPAYSRARRRCPTASCARWTRRSSIIAGRNSQKLAKRCLDGIKTIFKTTNPVIIYTATGTGAWEAALVNTLSPGDRVLMVETGQFATLWKNMAEKLGLKPEFIATDWRIGADPQRSKKRCARTRSTRSRRSACCITRPRPAACRRSRRSARRSTPPAIRRCSWSTPSPRSPRPIIAMTNGASTSPSAARRRA